MIRIILTHAVKYCMSKKPNLCSNLQYKMGSDFLDRQYVQEVLTII